MMNPNSLICKIVDVMDYGDDSCTSADISVALELSYEVFVSPRKIGHWIAINGSRFIERFKVKGNNGYVYKLKPNAKDNVFLRY